MRMWFFGLLLVLVGGSVWATESLDGNWRLLLQGRQQFEFGDQILVAGVGVDWRTRIDFAIRDGRFQSGIGQTRLTGATQTLSHPDDWFRCRVTRKGWLTNAQQPISRARPGEQGYAVNGEARGMVLTLAPGYRRPGDYLALSYSCETSEPGADGWLSFGWRAKNQLRRQQNVATHRLGTHQLVEIDEVQRLPPPGKLRVMLQDGWSLEIGAPNTPSQIAYQVKRVSTD